MEVTQWLPRWALDVALTIHHEQAILASLVIIVWHCYHVIFDLDVYPENLARWDGNVSQRIGKKWSTRSAGNQQSTRDENQPY